MKIFNNLIEIKNNWQPYKQWEIEQNKKAKASEILKTKYPPTKEELDFAKNKGKTIINAIDSMDNSTIDKTEDINLMIKNYSKFIALSSMGLGVLIGVGFRKTKLAQKLPDLKPYWELLGLLITSSITTTGLNIWQASSIKKASRLARYHTRENELKDYRNFVVYTDEQRKEAESIKQNLPDENFERKTLFNIDIFNPIKSHKLATKTKKELNNDKENYKEWFIDYKNKEKNKGEILGEISKKVAAEDVEKAEKERNVILNVVKKIENKSNEYSTNIEIATWCLTAGITAIGTLVGGAFCGLISLLKKNLKLSANANSALKLFQFSLLTFIPAAATMVAVAPAVRLVKEAARVGRYKAKQELLNNPEEFISFTDKELASMNVKEEKPEKKNFNRRFIDDIKLALKFKDEAKEYFDYYNNVYPEEIKTQKALKQVQITDEQIKEAKKLQQILFNVFEKVDEKQVSFVEDTDAAVDILQGVGVSTIGFVLKLLPVYFCAKDVKRINNGKIPQDLKEVVKVLSSGKLKPITIATIVLPFIIPRFLNYYAIVKGVQIKKDAGKIGVMRAVKELEDPREFIINADKKRD